MKLIFGGLILALLFVSGNLLELTQAQEEGVSPEGESLADTATVTLLVEGMMKSASGST